MKVSQSFLELQTQTVGSTLGWLQFTKGHNSVKVVDRIMALISTQQLSKDGHSTQQLSKDGQTNVHMKGQQTRSLYCACLRKAQQKMILKSVSHILKSFFVAPSSGMHNRGIWFAVPSYVRLSVHLSTVVYMGNRF